MKKDHRALLTYPNHLPPGENFVLAIQLTQPLFSRSKALWKRGAGSISINTSEVSFFSYKTELMEVCQLRMRLLVRVREFNACVPYMGVSPSASLPEISVHAIYGLLPDPAPESAPPPGSSTAAQVRVTSDAVTSKMVCFQMITVLQCLQRLSASPVITPMLLCAPDGIARVFSALLCGHDHVATEAARLLVRLWAPGPGRFGAGPWKLTRAAFSDESDPSATNSAEDNQNARSAKSICLSPISRRCQALLKPMSKEPRASQLVSMALVEAVGSLICEPASHTTEQAIFKTMLELCSSLGRPLFGLFSHVAGRVCDGAAVIMRSVAECGAVAAAPMRDAALREGALLHHLSVALFGKGSRNILSRELVALWADQFTPALELLERIFPIGLILFLNSPLPVLKKLTHTNLPESRPRTPFEEHKISTVEEVPEETESQDQKPQAPVEDTEGEAISPQHSPVESPSCGASDAAERKSIDSMKQSGSGGASVKHHQTSARSSADGQGKDMSATKHGEPANPATEIHDLEPEDFLFQSTAQSPHLGLLANHLKGNWEVFWTNAMRDHCTAGLIWNERTRTELKEALEAEEKDLMLGRTRVAEGFGGYPSWNFKEFEVHYKSLERYLCIGGIYVKLLLENMNQGDVTLRSAVMNV